MKKIVSFILVFVMSIVLATLSYEKPFHKEVAFKDYDGSTIMNVNSKDCAVTTNDKNVFHILKTILSDQKIIKSSNKKDLHYDIYAPNVLMGYIPNLDSINDVSKINGRYVVDYDSLSSERVILEYYEDGTICKTIYDKKADAAVVVSNRSKSALIYEDLSKGVTIEFTPEELSQIEKLIDTNEIDKIRDMKNVSVLEEGGSILIQPTSQGSVKSSSKQTMTPVQNDFPSYTKEVIDSSYEYCNALDENVKISVKESRNNYVEKKYSFRSFTYGVTLTTIGLFLGQPQYVIEEILAAANILYTTISGVLALQESAEVAKDAEYSYWGAREGYAHDSTVYDEDVKVYFNSSQGTFDGGYNKYGDWTWIESPPSDAYDVSTTDIIDTTIENYNSCILLYGYCSMYYPD